MILVLAIGNTLRSDDGIGVHVLSALRAGQPETGGLIFRDGGTLGLALLPEIEDTDALIVLDATEMGAEPGTVRTLEGAAMDAQFSGRKRTVHEVALGDLMAAAGLSGSKPEKRALIAIQPASTDWGLEPTTAAAGAIPAACAAVQSLIARWKHER
jgi:hydrogenase maturation protease